MTQFSIKISKYFKQLGVLFLVLCSGCLTASATNTPSETILVISSYNPDTPQTSMNISAFWEEYLRLGGEFGITIENMNCKSFSEASLWKDRMRAILSKYTGEKQPRIIVLLGQEAWTSYLSQDSLLTTHVPIIGGMVSRNAVLLPDAGTNLATWMAESVDVVTDNVKDLRISGMAYEYDVITNIRLILDFYPTTKHIAFVSDNTYGGVSLQALVRKEMKENFPDLDLLLLDGRKLTIYSMLEDIAKLPPNTAILLGTWRVDQYDGYFMPNATYSMMMANPKVPTFSITSVGMGHWAIGGYIPQYRTIGNDIAHMALDFERQQDSGKRIAGIQIVPNTYCFDYPILQKSGFVNKQITRNALYYNKKISFFEEYKYEIIAVVAAFILLLLGFLLALYFFFRTKRLKDDLVQLQKDNVLIMNNVNTGIKFINQDFTVKWHNDIDFNVCGENTRYAQGQVCHKILRNLDEPCHYCPAVLAMKSGKMVDVVVKHGATYVYMVANPVFDKDHILLGVVMRMENITKQKQVEVELRLAKEKAEESDRLKSAFLANMSHEIRTPLNAIVGFSEVLSTNEGDVESGREYVSIIRKNSDLLLRLINDILDISRLETGRLKFTYEEYEIVSLCQSVLATTSYGKKEDVEYVFHSPVERYLLTTDVQRLQQVLINLLSNANKFTSAGTITLGIHVDEASDCIYFYVTDTGCGIPENKQLKIFERFEKLDEYVQGTGLGLAICKLTINMMGGDIWVDKDYKNGARFVVRHPLHIVIVPED